MISSIKIAIISGVHTYTHKASWKRDVLEKAIWNLPKRVSHNRWNSPKSDCSTGRLANPIQSFHHCQYRAPYLLVKISLTYVVVLLIIYIQSSNSLLIAEEHVFING